MIGARLVAVLAGTALAAASASPAAAAETSETRLVRAYAPIVMVRAQEQGPCDTDEEQFAPPTAVGSVLGNPRVRLRVRQDDGTTHTITRGPTADDLSGRGANAYLDLPGNTLEAGCTYARDFAALRKAGKAPAVTYAHVVTEPGHPGLAVQYWFFWYFNQFNDVHEADWEGMQLTFDASTPAAALAKGPDEIVVFQHAGGEKTAWDARKVEKEGTHPVVYAAAGSHATFYDSALYLGNGQGGSGLGCDNTTEPLTRTTPRAVLLPASAGFNGPFSWLNYTGRWGQRESGYNNGPTGPNTKTQWLQPFTWMDGVRSSSPQIPGGGLLGPTVTNGFCGTVKQLSAFLNFSTRTGPGALAVGLGLLVLLAIPIAATRWRPLELEPLRRVRAFGQVLRASLRLYRRHAAVLVPIGLTALLVMGAIEVVAWGVGLALGTQEANLVTGSSSSQLAFSTSLTGIAKPLGSAIVSGAVVAVLCRLERGEPTGFRAAYATVFARFWRLVGAQLLATVVVILIAFTIVGIPYALKKFVDWQFVQQEVVFEDRGVRDAMRGSSRLVRGRWWPTAWRAAVLWIISQVPGPVLGFALLFTSAPLVNVNLFGSLVFALLVPFVAIGRTLIYLDLCARRQEGDAVEPSRAPSPAPIPAT